MPEFVTLLGPMILLTSPFVGFAMAMSLYQRTMLRHEMTPTTFCRRCGYDMRGNPDALSCPECGEERPERDRDLLA